ncbi:hypothetical protein BR93DRAFT_329996 [Coniochaeta sp. PMI_546]|nr:hypothetical protein BR93DRAFT_329996 [Coniochaeta sp. PMI_546]
MTKQKHQCPFCPVKAKNLKALDTHKLAAHAPCPPCNRTFVDERALAQHCATSVAHKFLICKKCNRKFADSSTFHEHSIEHSLVTCPLCDQFSSNPADLKEHLQSAKCVKLHGLKWCQERGCFEESVPREGPPNDPMLPQEAKSGCGTHSTKNTNHDPQIDDTQSGDCKHGDTKDGSLQTDGCHHQAVNDVKCPMCLEMCDGPTILAFHLLSALARRSRLPQSF